MHTAARLLSVLLSAALVAGVAALHLIHRIEQPGPLDADHLVVVERGSGLRDIAGLLQADRVIDDPVAFLLAARLKGGAGGLQAGEYRIAAGAGVGDIVAQMHAGRTFVRKLTVPEGLTVPRVMALLAEEPALAGPLGEPPPEGSLLPDTYHFARGDSRAGLLHRMREGMDEALAAAWAERDPELPLATPAEALVLASIIERETAGAAERSRVAGVFVNRLHAGMKLQADATVAYALSGGTGQLDRPLTRTDWLLSSPFNTYVIAGLPPAPIANPGRESLRAAVKPERHDFLYFVADGTGGHAFAVTLAEHNRNVAHLQELRRQMSEQPAAAPKGGP